MWNEYLTREDGSGTGAEALGSEMTPITDSATFWHDTFSPCSWTLHTVFELNRECEDGDVPGT